MALSEYTVRVSCDWGVLRWRLWLYVALRLLRLERAAERALDACVRVGDAA